jgi:hypothetical protein
MTKCVKGLRSGDGSNLATLIAAVAVLAGASSASGQGSWRLIAKAGDPAPGSPSRYYANFNTTFLNNRGKVAFQSALTPTPGGSVTDSGLFTDAGGAMHPVARSGDPAPASLPGATWPLGIDVRNFDDLGDVLIGSGHTAGLGFTICLPDGSYRLLSSPTTPTSDWNQTDRILLNNGWVVLQSRIPGVTLNGPLFAGRADGPISRIIGPGDVLSGWAAPWGVVSDASISTLSSCDALGRVNVVASIGRSVGAPDYQGALYVLSPDGGITFIDRAYTGNYPGAPFQPGTTTYLGSNAVSDSGILTYTATTNCCGTQSVIYRNGLPVLNFPEGIGPALVPGEVPGYTPSTAIGSDGTMLLYLGVGGPPGTVYACIDPLGVLSRIARDGDPLDAYGLPGVTLNGGGHFPTPNALGQAIFPITVPTIGYSYALWDKARGFRRLPRRLDTLRFADAGPTYRIESISINDDRRPAGQGNNQVYGAGLNDRGEILCSLQLRDLTTNLLYAALAVYTPTAACPDFNGDGAVNTIDLTRFLSRFGQNVPPGTPESNVDLNGDGVVNVVDLTTFLGRFGQTCP